MPATRPALRSTVPQLGTSGALLKPGLSILTASRSDQIAAETPERRGLFSWYLCVALDGGAADIRGNVGLAGVWAYLTESFGPWEQRPTFKANIERVHVLRACNPSVSDNTLRQLACWFPTPEHEFPLDPSYEDTAGHGNRTNEDVFKQLQKCSYVKLIAGRRGVHVLCRDEQQGLLAHGAGPALPQAGGGGAAMAVVSCTGHQRMPPEARGYADREIQLLLGQSGLLSLAFRPSPPAPTSCSRTRSASSAGSYTWSSRATDTKPPSQTLKIFARTSGPLPRLRRSQLSRTRSLGGSVLRRGEGRGR